ncbi:MAG: chromosome segregation protein SMC [Thermoplasmatota archaeon]
MHLKRVEVENFKSFGRRLTIPFLNGFTSITGPNGSGKSNIGDAVLFVLGPNSNKAIRAGKLTDLIFNGGKDKQAADFCKVSLVFANEDRTLGFDADEVTFTRIVRLSRANPENSHSLFYVNGRPSSLAEFDELLSRSRISADGYNIVRQGDVTRIVEMSPLDRRRIVDEIAGITKFDADIEKANNERTQVEANLERVRIILEEIDRQLTSLAKEREDALKFKSAKDELDVVKAKMVRRKVEAVEASLMTAAQSTARYEAEAKGLSEELAKIEHEIGAAKREIESIEKEVAAKGGADAEGLRHKIDGLKEQRTRASERLVYVQGELGDLAKAKRTLEVDLKKAETQEKSLSAKKEQADAKRIAFQKELDETQAALTATRELVAKSTGTAGDMNRLLAELRVKHDTTSESRTKAMGDRDRLVERRDRLRASLAEAEERLETHKFALQSVDWEQKELGKAAPADSPEALRAELLKLKKAESDASKSMQELEPSIRRLQNDHSLLKAERDAAEAARSGYNRAVRTVLEARDTGQLKGICGTIAELAAVEPKLEGAMEVAAAARMQAIVVETDAHAAAAIDLLKKQRMGRATFLPLNKMAPGRPAGRPLMAVRDPDALGFAIDLIKFDEKYRNAFWYVFRDTVIVKDLGAARRLMGGVRLVTLEGDTIDAGGAMTGGVDEHRDRLKFGERAKDELEKLASKLRAALVEQERLVGELGEVREKISAVDGRLREATLGDQSRKDKIALLAERRKEADIKLRGTESEIESLTKDLKTTETDLGKAIQAIAALEKELSEMEAERQQKSKLMLAATRKELAEEHGRLQVAADEIRAKLRDAESLVATTGQQLEILQANKATMIEGLKENEEQRGVNEAAEVECNRIVSAADKELKVLLEVQSAQNEALKALGGRRDGAIERRSNLAAKAEKARTEMGLKRDLANRERARVPGLEAEKAELEQEAELLPVKAPPDFSETLEELKSRQRKLESQMEELGNVNLRAIEDFDQQTARKTQLTEETTRLDLQRTNLLTLVGEIVSRKKEGFFKVFNEINKNFADVFGRLSDGGKAELILENAEDPFVGGLIMRAQPKGKKLTRLEALSGGEKSLTSMAFIFAIQEFDPSPFYYLDEIDQNLDGINSELLARMIRQNSKHAQFIVVSLRKVTLKEADHVYGVTMQGDGQSVLVGEVHISEIADEPEPARSEKPMLVGGN